MMAGRRFDNDIGISMRTMWKLHPDGRKRYQKGCYAHLEEASVFYGAESGYDLQMLRAVLDEIRGEIEFSEYSDNLSKVSDSSAASQCEKDVSKNPHSQNDL